MNQRTADTMWHELLGKILRRKTGSLNVEVELNDGLLIIRCMLNGEECARILCVVESASTILISDIWHRNKKKDYNKGYGTLMMEFLIQYANNNNYECVYGNLSDIDLDHKERLHHFYRKFGFSVIEYSETQKTFYGKVILCTR